MEDLLGFCMVGILIIAHAPIASALKACVAHIYGSEPARIDALDVFPDDEPAQLVEAAREQLTRLGRRHGALVLTDLFGGTPSNIASQLADLPRVRVITGVNLPMLVRALCYRAMPLNTLVEKTVAGGVRGIQVIDPSALSLTAPLQKQVYKNPCMLGVEN